MDPEELPKPDESNIWIGTGSVVTDGSVCVAGVDTSSSLVSSTGVAYWTTADSNNYIISGSSYIQVDMHATMDFSAKPEQKLTITGLDNGTLISGTTNKDVVLDSGTIKRLAGMLAAAMVSDGEDLPDILLSQGGDNLVKMVIAEYLHSVDKTKQLPAAG